MLKPEDLKPGPELDLIVSGYVLKEVPCDAWNRQRAYPAEYYQRVPSCSHTSCRPGGFVAEFSTNIAAAWQIVEHFKKAQRMVSIQGEDWYNGGCYDVSIDKNGMRDRCDTATADTAPLAICLAALKAVGYFDREDEA